MSERNNRPGRHKLPLPAPGSPTALDQKILAYARDHAPQRKTRLAPRWAAGLAIATAAAMPMSTTRDLDGDDLALQIEHMAQLLQQGKEQQAHAMYEALRQACPDCALPLTLEQAIATMTETDSAE